MSSRQSIHIVFQPDGVRMVVPEGTTMLQAAHSAGIPIEGPCGGQGKCGKCRVKMISGAAAPGESDRQYLTEGELDQGFRLACQAKLTEDATIEIPVESRPLEQKVMVEGLEREVALDPHITKRYLALPEPSLEDDRSDLQRILDSLGDGVGCSSDLTLIRQAPQLVRDSDYQVTAILAGDELIGLENGDRSSVNYGMAFDLGTTTVVGYLINLSSGEQVAAGSCMNPQVTYGDDVISRIQFATQSEHGLELLQGRILEAINQIIARTVQAANISSADIYEVTVVGNTCMSQLFLGIDSGKLAVSPYVAAISGSQDHKARDLGVNINPQGRVHVLPNIAGFVGADTVGVMLASRLSESPQLRVAIDIGTNGEVVASWEGKLVACSTAAGPAFEGARIGQGMRAAAGAIDRVAIDDDLQAHTIDDAPARGLCGSGLIDAVAGLCQVGIVEESGRMLAPESASSLSPKLATRLRSNEGGVEFVLVPARQSAIGRDIVITQKDIREVQLAKGAISAGISMVLDELGAKPSQVTELMLAGAFGNYLRQESAVAIGLVPALAEGRIRSIGNAAGAGSKLALTSRQLRDEADGIARRTEHLQLAHRADFYDQFTEAMSLAPRL